MQNKILDRWYHFSYALETLEGLIRFVYWTSSKSYLCSHRSGNWIWQRKNPSFMFMLCSYWMDLPRNMKKIWYPQPRFTRRQIHIVLDYIIHVNPPFPCCLHLQPAEGLFVMPHPTAQQAAHPLMQPMGGPCSAGPGLHLAQVKQNGCPAIG